MTQIDETTFMAYVDGELGPDDALVVEQAANDDPEIGSRLDSLRSTGELLENIYGPVLAETPPEALQKIIDKKPVGGRRRGQRKSWMAMAASVVIIVSAGLLTNEIMVKKDKSEPVEASKASPKSVVPQAFRPPRQPRLPRPAATQMDMNEEAVMPKVYESRPSMGGGYSAQAPAGTSYSVTPSVAPSYAEKRIAAPRPPMPGPSRSYILKPKLPRMEPLKGNQERYKKIDDNGVKRVTEKPVSTFSIDVDTGSYANLRRFLEGGRLPPADAVRVEEMINYFDYAYPVPESRDAPFTVTTDMSPAFWNHDLRLLRIGLKGYEVSDDQRPSANLVFLIDVSGSMNEPRKLPLLKASLKLLTGRLSKRDRISIVVYAGQSRVALEPVSGDNKTAIYSAIDGLSAGGSTAGGAGLRLAYEMASKEFIKEGVNRVLLATDGDFNIGVSNVVELKKLVADKRKEGISLTTLGFGSGNYNEALMEQIADVGDGNYAYIDSLREGRKVLVGELNSTLITIARDVKIQVEFNAARVAEYRLIGYENRVLRREDFSNDKVDAGDLGAGHTVTALYELVLSKGEGARIDPLRYGKKQSADSAKSDELAFVRLRYKLPGEDKSRLMETPIKASLAEKKVEEASNDLRFAGAVAAFGQMLRGGNYTGKYSYSDVVSLARNALGSDHHGYRREFADLVELVKDLNVKPANR